MRDILIDLSSDNIHSTPQFFGGIQGEHNESNIIVTLPSRMLFDDVSYYYFKFETESGDVVTSPNIPRTALIDDEKVSVKLWGQITNSKKLICNIVAETLNGDSIEVKGKSPTFSLILKDGADGNNIFYNPEGNEEMLQEAINNALLNAKESGEFEGEQGKPFTYEDFTDEQLAGLKGEQGTSGVYYGTEEPTDPSHPLWINPEGEGFDSEPATKDYVDTEVAGAKNYAKKLVDEIVIPTKTSDLENDSNFIKSGDITIPTKVSDLENDTGFTTSSDLPTKLSDLTNDTGFRKITYGTEEPTNDEGEDGDIYIQIIQ